MVVVSMLPHAEIGGNDHREDAPQFIITLDFDQFSFWNDELVTDHYQSLNVFYVYELIYLI